jgi:transglutaminase-like putative cysteine protease
MRHVSIPNRANFASIILAAALAIAGALAALAAAPAPAPDKVRDIVFTYHTVITVTDTRAHRVAAWIPLPREGAFQSVSGLAVESPVAHTRIVKQSNGGNRVLYLEAVAPIPASIPVTVRFRVHRVEESADLAKARRDVAEPTDGGFGAFLRPYRLVPTGGRIAQVSATVGDTGASPYEQAHAIYQYVIANMKYDKSGTGWGRGDAIYACDVKKGNCTDFHSLFIALARSRGIPARFTIGFPLGDTKSGAIPGYHCWAEFYAGGQWVPVDASEAWKHPDRHDYYFGHLDADRVAFTWGRDLVLKPRQAGAPLNYLIYPYVEIDGKAVGPADVKNRFEYADVAPSH